ncbi:hypothetical protein DWB61_13565 [Ancylomarina euxinus]|uniref:Tetratricopeptide repeat protein n=1 Tax=Ancylomarina euxinus TaxID=2283627 RepID=A0A425XYI6_9BACT|nr:hypothetical protein [Ancylomarina euxinus]MCZ4695750.1 hypothetical protein [Ancylomarina euxinus]MUP16203.1 hypothetical protein [Ancylomarina euxinus]RRG20063.1 hypothetical protein DWB61_13565 [Ancylomarina euxinus]
MRKLLTYIFVLISSSVFACGGGYWEGMNFYNLFKQTNIAAEEFYPFLRSEYNAFYGEDFYGQTKPLVYPKGNVALWHELLIGWDTQDIEKAVYEFDKFDWSGKDSAIEQSAKTYLAFANRCSNAFSYRTRLNSWDYDEVLEKETVDEEALLKEANLLLSQVSNQQLQMRYYYQMIRIMHYSKDWTAALRFYESKVEDQFPKNEMYYYISDQVAGCYYSLENYEKAAYLFTKVLNKSLDRKKTAFSSYNFCTYKNAEGKSLFKGLDDEKDLLLIRSLRNFTDEVSNINRFIELDAQDERVELLFMRALNNVEREVWPKDIGVGNKSLPFYDNNNTYKDLLRIAEQQVVHSTVTNKAFWKLSSSYLSFIKQDIASAKAKLAKVEGYPEQKKKLAIIYEVFSWENLTVENENYLAKILADNPKNTAWISENENDWRRIILAKVAHTYYKNNKLAKAFLVHNTLENVNQINSIELLEALEAFYLQTDKSEYEKVLLSHKSNASLNFMDYINDQKGIYYLYQKDPESALEFFNKNETYEGQLLIPASIFSNNLKECFSCSVEEVMDDEVYKADIFSFIQASFSRKNLARNLIELEKLTQNEKKWKAKLANYLLGNYYFNISNTGYYRGLLRNKGNCCEYSYMHYAYYSKRKISKDIITEKKGYNLLDISNYGERYFDLSSTAMQYYQNVMEMSTDKELNARCLYLMAKCELNTYYNLGSKDELSFQISKYYDLKLPNYKSFKILKESYADTKFHEMIIKECSYFRLYSSHY